MTLYLQSAVSGLLAGGLYAIMALGLSLTWGLLRVINLAHFALILLGAYATYALAGVGLDPLLSVLFTVPAFFVVGAAMQWLFDRFAVADLTSLLVGFGLFIMLIQVATNVWTADFRRLDAAANPYGTSAVFLGDIALPVAPLLALLTALAIAAAVAVGLRRTYAGKALRAFAHDREVAAAFGIDHRRIALLLSGFAAATGALAGAFVAIGGGIFPGRAIEWFGIVFTVVILGGIGNLLGAVVAALLVGLVSAVTSTAWSPAAAPLVTFALLIVALLFRPDGLFGGSGAT